MDTEVPAKGDAALFASFASFARFMLEDASSPLPVSNAARPPLSGPSTQRPHRQHPLSFREVLRHLSPLQEATRCDDSAIVCPPREKPSKLVRLDGEDREWQDNEKSRDEEQERDDDDVERRDEEERKRDGCVAVRCAAGRGDRRSARRTELLATLHGQKRRRLEDEERRCEELYAVRRSALKATLARLDRLQRQRRRERDRGRRFAADGCGPTNDALAALIPDAEVRDLLCRFAAAGLCRLRLVRRRLDGSWCVLAVVLQNDFQRRFLLPRNLHEVGSVDGGDARDETRPLLRSRWPRCDMTRYEKGDCAGYLSTSSTVFSSSAPSPGDAAAGRSGGRIVVAPHYVLDDRRPHDLPSDMLAVASPPRRLWLASFWCFYSRLALSNSALFSGLFAIPTLRRPLAGRRDARRGATAATRLGISRRLVAALVASRQASLFCTTKSRREVSSLSDVEAAGRRFAAHFRTDVVAPHVERFLAAYSRTPFARPLQAALEESLPFARWTDRNDRLPEPHDDDDDDRFWGRRCALSGASRDLVAVAFARCPLLEWKARGAFLPRKTFSDHLEDFAARFRAKQARWSREFFAGDDGDASDRAARDYGGFLLSPWKDSTLLQRTVAQKAMHCWRLLHFELVVDASLLFLHDSPDFDADDDDDDADLESDPAVHRWRQLRRSLADDPVECIVDALMESLKSCSED